MSIYESSMEQNIPTQSKLSHAETDTFGHIRRDKHEKNKDFDGNKSTA